MSFLVSIAGAFTGNPERFLSGPQFRNTIRPYLAIVATALLLTAVSASAFVRSADAQEPSADGAVDSAPYTPIPQVFLSNDVATSFIRFANVSGGPANFEVKVSGGQSGIDYTAGSPYRITVPDNASVQRSLDQIRTAILDGGGPDIALKDGDTFLNLFVTSDKAGSGAQFQHVTHAADTGFIENASACTYDSAQNYAGKNALLINVHTSQLLSYPSQVTVHNPDAVSRSIRATVYDAVTGTLLGSFNVYPAAMATLVLDAAEIERQINFTPNPDQLHVNIAFSANDGLPYTAVVAHNVHQSSGGARFNLTNFCAVNPARTSSCDTAPGATETPGESTDSSACRPLRANFDILTDRFVVDQPATIQLPVLTANDTGAEGAILNAVNGFADGDSVTNGTFSFTSTSITYTPAREGTVYFTYRLRNAAGEAATGTVNLTVSAPSSDPGESDPIIAVPDTLTSNWWVGGKAGVMLTAVTGNDTNADGATFDSVTPFVDQRGVANGQWSVLPNMIVYTPARAGTVTFTYRLKNAAGQKSNPAQVTLSVNAPSAVPKNPPVAADDTIFNVASTARGYVVNLTQLTANDINAAGATLASVSQVYDLRGQLMGAGAVLDGATLSLNVSTSNPAVATFTYQIRTAVGTSNPATVTIHFAGPGKALPVPVADILVPNSQTLVDYFRVNTQTNLMFTRLLANDSMSGATTFTIAPSGFRSRSTGAVNGKYWISNDRVVYQPDRAGEVIFSYYLTNSVGRSKQVQVRLTVAP